MERKCTTIRGADLHVFRVMSQCLLRENVTRVRDRRRERRHSSGTEKARERESGFGVVLNLGFGGLPYILWHE